MNLNSSILDANNYIPVRNKDVTPTKQRCGVPQTAGRFAVGLLPHEFTIEQTSCRTELRGQKKLPSFGPSQG